MSPGLIRLAWRDSFNFSCSVQSHFMIFHRSEEFSGAVYSSLAMMQFHREVRGHTWRCQILIKIKCALWSQGQISLCLEYRACEPPKAWGWRLIMDLYMNLMMDECMVHFSKMYIFSIILRWWRSPWKPITTYAWTESLLVIPVISPCHVAHIQE